MAKKVNPKREKEFLLKAEQNHVIRTNYIKTKIDNYAIEKQV